MAKNIVLIRFSSREKGNCKAIAEHISTFYSAERVYSYFVDADTFQPCSHCDYECLHSEKVCPYVNAVQKETTKLEDLGKNPIVITSPIVRMYFKKLTEEYFKDLIVVSYNEIESNVELQSVGMVTV